MSVKYILIIYIVGIYFALAEHFSFFEVVLIQETYTWQVRNHSLNTTKPTCAMQHS